MMFQAEELHIEAHAVWNTGRLQHRSSLSPAYWPRHNRCSMMENHMEALEDQEICGLTWFKHEI